MSPLLHGHSSKQEQCRRRLSLQSHPLSSRGRSHLFAHLPLQHLPPRGFRAFRRLANFRLSKLRAFVGTPADLSVFTRRNAHILQFLRLPPYLRKRSRAEHHRCHDRLAGRSRQIPAYSRSVAGAQARVGRDERVPPSLRAGLQRKLSQVDFALLSSIFFAEIASKYL